MKEAPALPFLIRVEDYHEFPGVERAMSLINPEIKVRELAEQALSEELKEKLFNLGSYIGIVYEGRMPSEAVIREMLGAKRLKIHAA